jgi:hypothetical protein
MNNFTLTFHIINLTVAKDDDYASLHVYVLDLTCHTDRT